MIASLLIANRGEIACRIMKTAKQMGIKTIAIASEQDKNARHSLMADDVILLKEGPASENYLNIQAIIEAAKRCSAEAIHPGYGFLSENPDFADAVRQAGIRFVGPSAETIRQMGLKDKAKTLMQAAGVPVVPGYLGDDQSSQTLSAEADKIGYPVMIKARAGGGGKGMRLVTHPDQFNSALESAKREAESSFGDGHVLLEKYIVKPRHIEVQILCDSHGNAVHLYERDCSLQRRHQKVIEEAPAPNMPDAMRKAMTQAAITAAQTIQYENAGTVEFIVDTSQGLHEAGFWFMEMNTRLQVEHPVTEAITGIDLVKAQIEIAAGEKLAFSQDDISVTGHAVEARLYAENPKENFRPAPGRIHLIELAESPFIRIDTGISSGDIISPSYDPLIAKIIATGTDRLSAMRRLADALASSLIVGTDTNRAFLGQLATLQASDGAPLDTGVIEDELALFTQIELPSKPLLVMAALASLPDQPDAFTGWRQWGAGEMPISLSVTGQTEPHEITLMAFRNGQYRCQISDELLEITSINITADAPYMHISFSMADRIYTGKAIWHEDRLIALCGNEQASFDKISASNASTSISHDGFVIAPMTSVVKAVHVKKGQTITSGELLILIEAMKMEYPLIAPFDGVVEDISCAAGDSVNDGQILMRLENSGNDEDG